MFRGSRPEVLCKKRVLKNLAKFRSSRPEVFSKKGVLKNLAKFRGLRKWENAWESVSMSHF